MSMIANSVDCRAPSHIEGAPSRISDQSKICQWYCCLCGQLYGSIIYTNDTDAEITSTTADATSLDDYLIRSIKYYSQIVYNTPALHSPDATSVYAAEINPYEQLVVLRLALLNDLLSPLLIEDTNVTPTPIFLRNTPNLPYGMDKTAKVRDDVILNVPTRFTCHRCDHMMCPYCPKVRVKDL